MLPINKQISSLVIVVWHYKFKLLVTHTQSSNYGINEILVNSIVYFSVKCTLWYVYYTHY